MRSSGRLRGRLWLIASLLYGSGLRLQECLSLRVKDLDFERRVLVVRDGKGRKDRETVFPSKLLEPLRQHLEWVRAQHDKHLTDGRGAVTLPDALARKSIQELLGHRDLTTTMIYTHVTTIGSRGVRSPLDQDR